MATPAWPAGLPQCPVLNGFSERRQRNVVTFNPEVGPQKARRRSTAATVLTGCTFRMTNAQKLTFDTFYETTLADGSLPFTWAHPVTKVGYTWMFAQDESPQRNRATPNTFTISFNLVRLP